jgi:GTP cyclohydrolase I
MKPGAVMRTSSMHGSFRTNTAARAEVLTLLGVS